MSHVKSGIQETFKNYELNFNNNKDFQITANYKKVSAYPHGDKKNKKITFIFHGLAAFTFEIRDLKTLTEQQEWRGLIRHQPAALNMRIQDDKQTLKGEGTLGDNKIKVNGLFQKSGVEEYWQYGGQANSISFLDDEFSNFTIQSNLSIVGSDIIGDIVFTAIQDSAED